MTEGLRLLQREATDSRNFIVRPCDQKRTKIQLKYKWMDGWMNSDYIRSVSTTRRLLQSRWSALCTEVSQTAY
jgi:hypothetical protein